MNSLRLSGASVIVNGKMDRRMTLSGEVRGVLRDFELRTARDYAGDAEQMFVIFAKDEHPAFNPPHRGHLRPDNLGSAPSDVPPLR